MSSAFTVERLELHVSPDTVERGIDRTLLIYVETLTNRDRNRELDRIQKREEGTRRIKIKKRQKRVINYAPFTTEIRE